MTKKLPAKHPHPTKP